MKTVNISLPSKLKVQADSLVKDGYYASLSDLVRDALRQTIEKKAASIPETTTSIDESANSQSLPKTQNTNWEPLHTIPNPHQPEKE